MKLAILADSHLLLSKHINGTLVQLNFLSEEFSNEGIEVYYICKNDQKNPNHISTKIKFELIDYPQNIFTPFYQKTLYYNALKKIKPDCIYVRGRSIFQHIASKYQKNYKINYVWHTNGKDGVMFWKNLTKLISSKKSILKKIVLLPPTIFHDMYINNGLKNSKKIINQTEDQKILTEKILSIQGNIIPNFFPKINYNGKKDNKIIWLANLSKSKSPEKFIEIIKKTKLNDWSAILAGGTSDKYYSKKIKESSQKSNIDFFGRVDFHESTELIAQSKIYINTSDSNSDGLSNAFIQSWLSGTIVISLNHNPNDWMHKHNIGFFASGSLEKLLKKLNLLINNQNVLEEMSKNAKKFAKKTFSSRKIIKKYISILESNN